MDTTPTRRSTGERLNRSMPSVLRHLTAFSTDPSGGNPAGVWVGDAFPPSTEMQRIAAEVGYSETAFATRAGEGRWRVRFFSPEAEVPFCGHATVATGVLLGELHGDGTFRFETPAGEVDVEVAERDGRREASLTSVEPAQRAAPDALLDEALASLGWERGQLDPAIAPALAYAGVWHLVIAVASKATLDALDYDFGRLKALMLGADLTTLQLVWRESPDVFHARNPFPVGGVVEDPATGAAAAALGGYLRDAGLIRPPATILIRQGEAMGRPSRLTVEIPERGGVVVRGSAVPIDG